MHYCRIHPHHHVAAHRSGAKARCENAHRPIDSSLPHGVMNRQEDAGGGSVPDAFNIEVKVVGGHTSGLGQIQHHVLVGLVGNDQINCVHQRAHAPSGRGRALSSPIICTR